MALARLDVAGLIAAFGSERKAAAATGISRGTLNDIARGVRVASERVVQALESGVDAAIKATGAAITELARDLGGGNVQASVAQARQLAAQQRSNPQAVADQLAARQARMARAGLRPNGESIPPPPPDLPPPPATDKLGRRITDGQRQAYERLKELHRNNDLNTNNYERFLRYQFEDSESVDIDGYDQNAEYDEDE